MSLTWDQMLFAAIGVLALIGFLGLLVAFAWLEFSDLHDHGCGCRVRDGFMERCHSHRGTQALFPVESRRRAR